MILTLQTNTQYSILQYGSVYCLETNGSIADDTVYVLTGGDTIRALESFNEEWATPNFNSLSSILSSAEQKLVIYYYYNN